MSKPIWTVSVDVKEINERCRNTLSDHLGIEFIEMGPAHLTARMPIDRRTIQPMGIMHGGASCVLAETVGSAAANYCVDPTKVCVGLDININHMKAVKSGSVTGVASPFHLGKTTQVWDIKIYDETKQLIAVSRLTIAIIDKK